ncbi:VanW family protein [Cohnella sp.]|uniref:VanW family protein n=1 Tax=Cohnella sp. TaxID=1883426 RepID=UPI003561F0EC
MRKGWLITCLLALLIIAAGAGGTIYYGSDETMPEGTHVGGLAVGGQTADESLRQIQNQVAKLEKVTVTVTPPTVNGTIGDSLSDSTRTLEELGMHIDATDAVKAIEDFRDASWWERALIRYQNKMKSSYDIHVTWDEEMFQKEATSSWSQAAGLPPKEATRTINERDEVVYTSEVIGTKLDIPALLVKVKTYEPKSLAAGSVEEIEDITIELPVIQTAPEITLAKLKEEGIERKIIEFTTDFSTSGEGRTHNVTAAAKALNETLLLPDEIFEYGKIVAKADKEYGYKEAPVILKGKLTPGIGGGICQVSSTLYNAALLAGLDIVERRNHSLVVGYLPKGLDATFADGYINFKFRNSTGKQLLIRTVVIGKKVTVKLFGTKPEDVSYRTETEQVKENPPKIVYVANDKLILGKQETLQKGSSGYVVESYLLKLVSGELVERKKLSKDTYRSQDTMIAVNPHDPRLNLDGSTPTPGATPAPEGTDGPVEPI